MNMNLWTLEKDIDFEHGKGISIGNGKEEEENGIRRGLCARWLSSASASTGACRWLILTYGRHTVCWSNDVIIQVYRFVLETKTQHVSLNIERMREGRREKERERAPDKQTNANQSSKFKQKSLSSACLNISLKIENCLTSLRFIFKFIVTIEQY